MKAWILTDYSGVDSMEVKEVEKPAASAGRVVVKLHYAALNPADNYLSLKQYPAKPAFPHILGRDGCGTVEEVGSGVTSLKKGDVVALLRGEAGVTEWGTLAEYVSVPAAMVIPVPVGWDEKEAAAAPLVYLTAHQALYQWGPIEPGDNIFVTGISGGVGVACLQLAKAARCRVIGTSRSAEKSRVLKQMGADLIIDPYDPELVKKVREFCGKSGVQVAVDNIAGKAFDSIIDVMGQNGCISTVGRLAGPVPELNTGKLFFRRLKIGGVAVATYAPEESKRYWKDVVDALGRLGQKPLIDHVFEFGEVKQAFKRLAEGPLGKVLIRHG